MYNITQVNAMMFLGGFYFFLTKSGNINYWTYNWSCSYNYYVIAFYDTKNVALLTTFVLNYLIYCIVIIGVSLNNNDTKCQYFCLKNRKYIII